MVQTCLYSLAQSSPVHNPRVAKFLADTLGRVRIAPGHANVISL